MGSFKLIGVFACLAVLIGSGCGPSVYREAAPERKETAESLISGVEEIEQAAAKKPASLTANITVFQETLDAQATAYKGHFVKAAEQGRAIVALAEKKAPQAEILKEIEALKATLREEAK